MARKLRLQYPGAIYHVMSRGGHLEPVFLEEADRRLFLSTLGESCVKTDWQVHAYCLMSNHFHLVLETPRRTWPTASNGWQESDLRSRRKGDPSR